MLLRLPHMLSAIALTMLVVGVCPASAQEAEADILELSRHMITLEQAGRHAEALPLARRAVELAEMEFGPEHQVVAVYLEHLAVLYHKLLEIGESEALFLRTLRIQEKVLGPDHVAVASTLNHLGGLYQTTGDYPKSVASLERALLLREQAFGADHPATATIVSNLAILRELSGEYDEAEPLFERYFTMAGGGPGGSHPSLKRALESYLHLLQQTHRSEEAARVEGRLRQLEDEGEAKESPF